METNHQVTYPPCMPSFCILSLTRKPVALQCASQHVRSYCLNSRSRLIRPRVRNEPDTLFCQINFSRSSLYRISTAPCQSIPTRRQLHVRTVPVSSAKNHLLTESKRNYLHSLSRDSEEVSACAGTPEGVQRVREAFTRKASAEPLTSEFQAEIASAYFSFPLDSFQQEALHALTESRNVILSAPTGSGKTVVGEMAILLALGRGLRVFYTTPLKALSNQKFFDFKNLFGENRVGLLTGDIAVNRDAEIVVMTTEVYRNMLYADSPGRDENIMPVTDDVFAVVFDEFHYLNDPDRGTVWEESVVNSPHHVLLVALSATMANASDLRDWFSDVHGPTVLVESNHRPVPLKFSFCQREGMIPLLASEGADVLSKSSKSRRRRDKASNGDGKSRKPKMHPSLMTLIAEGLPDKNRDRMQRRRQRPDEKRKGFDEAKKLAVLLEKYDSSSARDKSRPRRRYRDVPSFPFVVRVLRRKDMLPSIVFIFSRNGCDRAAMAAATERSQLVTASEERAIRERIDAFTAEHPGLVSSERIALALQGIASHHAGLLPIWKACVEGLFQDNLIKVVFATETLAAGINMPARTTVISALSKRSGDANIVPLSTSQVLQMAGRAGRRGKDSVGYSVIMRSPYEGPIEAFRVVTADVDVLNSHFTPSYGMVLNLLQTRSLDDARILVERSFGSFLRQKQLAKQEASKEMLLEKRDTRQMEKEEAEKAALQAVLREAQEIVSRVNEKGLSSYITAVERVKAERRALSYVERQSRQINSQLIEDTLPFAPPGTRLRLRGSRVSGESRGVIRRKKRREFAHALAAASDGDGGAEVRAYFLENDWERTYDIEDESDEEGEREILDGVLLDLGPEVGVSVLFAAVCDNGSMCFFSHENVETMYFDEDPVNVDVLVPEWKHVELPPRSSWHGISSNQYFAPVPADLEPLVKAISAWKSTKSQQVLGVETESKTCEAEIDHSPDVLAQREKLAYAKSLVRDHVLHGEAETVLALRARKACRQLEAQLSAYTSLNEQSSPKRSSSRSSGRGRQKQVSGKMLVDDKHEPSIPPADSFSDFMDIVRVSQEYGFIDSEYCVTSLGDVGAKIRAENELWTSLVLLDSALEDASPVHFSAIMGAVLSEGGRQEDYVAYEPSQESLKLARDLEPLRTRLLSVQATYGVDFPVSLEIEHMGLVEAWASGETWVDLLRNTTLQEGDVCRILRRVLDILRQIPHVPFVSDKIKLNARRALTLASRFPVVDDQTYTVRESEKTYQDSSEETYGTSDSAYDPEDNPNSL